MKKLIPLAVFVLAVHGVCRCVQAADKPDQAALEKQFAEKLTGAKLVGHYTLWGKEDKPKRDTYYIDKVRKVKGDVWEFTARIVYGEKDVKIPIQLPVRWAGDTPVISLDKLAIPLLGTFSCRLVIDGDYYAGTWDGGDHGGHMYGNIVKEKKDKAKKTSPK